MNTAAPGRGVKHSGTPLELRRVATAAGYLTAALQQEDPAAMRKDVLVAVYLLTFGGEGATGCQRIDRRRGGYQGGQLVFRKNNNAAVRLYVGDDFRGERIFMSAARLMCWAHKGMPPRHKPLCCHRGEGCGHRQVPCIRPDHLFWGTAKENSADKRRGGSKR